jgi:hypothetical protein
MVIFGAAEAINAVCRALLYRHEEKAWQPLLSTAVHVSYLEMKFARREKSLHIIILCNYIVAVIK